MIGVNQIGIPKGQSGWISKLNPLNWFKKENIKNHELGYTDWTQQQWDNMNQRYRNHTNIKEITEQTVYNNSEDYKIYGLHTTPQKDSLWYSTTSNPEQELIVFKNSETGDYIYNKQMNGKLIEENRAKQLPSNIKELINLINNGL